MSGAGGSSEPERTEDGRWIVVDGRRWRASDPNVPDRLRQELVDELMDARRSVGQARRTGDPGAERAARDRVHHAKVALGERGEPWWEPTTPGGRDTRLAAATLALTERRAPDRTICPSDVARVVGGATWRPLMEPTREVVRGLAARGEVEVTQRGEVVDPTSAWKGPIRVRRASGPGAADDEQQGSARHT